MFQGIESLCRLARQNQTLGSSEIISERPESFVEGGGCENGNANELRHQLMEQTNRKRSSRGSGRYCNGVLFIGCAADFS